MPTIIDSLFLELGIDTAKFSKDQQAALAKIAQFEAKAKKSGKGAGDAIKTVGDAFRDLAKESRIGSSGAGIDNLAKKLTMLGKSAQVAGIFGGAAAEGLGMLLSPAALGIAAVGLLGAEMWDLNKKMTVTNATIYRQAQLSGMNAANLWDWGEAARTVGANPQEVTGGIAALQTQIMGMGIGAANATPQLVALARLGVGFNFKTGANIPQLVARVHAMAAANGYQNLGALRALTGPVMNDALFNIATNPTYDPNKLQQQIKGQEAPNTGEILRKSLESQSVLGKFGIAKDVLAETAYGGEQGLMQAVVQILTSILDVLSKIAGVIVHPIDAVKSVWDSTVDAVSRGIDQAVDLAHRPSAKMSAAMQALMGTGMSESDAAAMVGNMAQESSMNPLARNGSHVGLGQWDKTRQAAFAKRFGYQMGSSAVSADKQFNDQLTFAQDELQGTHQRAGAAMAKARDLMGKTSAFMSLDEAPGDGSLGKRFAYAQQAMRLADVAGMTTRHAQSTVTSETHIGEINLYTPSTDPAAHADAVIKGVSTHPLVSPIAQGTVALGTRGMTG